MDIAEFVRAKAQQNSKTETITLRLPLGVVGDIDDLSATLNVTRQEMLQAFVEDGLKTALSVYEEEQNIPMPDDAVAEQVDASSCFFMLNTNKRHSASDHLNMVSNGIAAAFCDPWKWNIDKFRKGDTVFLYESGVGIVGIGKAPGGSVEVSQHKGVDGEMHYQKLSDYRKVTALNAREIKKLVGHNMVFLQTMFTVPPTSGAIIEKHLS
jgi:hypothetical protein